MAIELTPLDKQSEFDDIPPVSAASRAMLWVLRPFLAIHNLVVWPFRIRRTTVRPRVIQMQPLTVEQQAALPNGVSAFLDTTEAAVARIGFNETIRHGDFSQGLGVVYAAFIPSTSQEDLCVVQAMHAPRRYTMTGVWFLTRMSDGLLIATENETFGPFRRRPAHHEAVTFAEVADIAALYDIHRRRKARAARAGRAPVPVDWRPPGIHPLEMFQRMVDERIDDAVKHGTIEPPATGEVRLTLKGAALDTWRLQWPLRQISEWQQRRRAARVLRELETTSP